VVWGMVGKAGPQCPRRAGNSRDRVG
jgi:hypothetical protein